MPRVRRVADAVWEGDLARGGGKLSAATGAFAELPYSLPARIGASPGLTSPEELLAAAHAGCFAMSLAGELSAAGSPPDRLEVRCTITVDEVEGAGHLVVDSTIDVTARAAGLDAGAFGAIVDTADAGCTFSSLVRASATVSVSARLEEGSDGD